MEKGGYPRWVGGRRSVHRERRWLPDLALPRVSHRGRKPFTQPSDRAIWQPTAGRPLHFGFSAGDQGFEGFLEIPFRGGFGACGRSRGSGRRCGLRIPAFPPGSTPRPPASPSSRPGARAGVRCPAAPGGGSRIPRGCPRIGPRSLLRIDVDQPERDTQGPEAVRQTLYLGGRSDSLWGSLSG